MLPQAGALMICAILTCITYSQGMLFALDTTPENISCGRLQCLADRIYTDTNVFYVSALTIYDVTKSSNPVKLAAVSVNDSAVELVGIDITATGNISLDHAELTLGLRDRKHCLSSSFLCELNFVNSDGVPDVIRQTMSPGSSGNCPAVFRQISQVVEKVTEHSHELEEEIDELKQQNPGLKPQLVSSTLPDQCLRGMPHNKPRELFIFLGRMVALCDTETDGGGWIVIQRRTTGTVDFYRGWKSYKNGFGTPDTDFWMGNDNIHYLTSHGYTDLRVDLEYQGKQYFAHYSNFYVADESSNYRLSVSRYSGTAGDSLKYHDGSDFSTYDRDHDTTSYRNCAEVYSGAWWYDNCFNSNLNGLWGVNSNKGVVWEGIAMEKSVSYSEMKIRHV